MSPFSGSGIQVEPFKMVGDMACNPPTLITIIRPVRVYGLQARRSRLSLQAILLDPDCAMAYIASCAAKGRLTFFVGNRRKVRAPGNQAHAPFMGHCERVHRKPLQGMGMGRTGACS